MSGRRFNTEQNENGMIRVYKKVELRGNTVKMQNKVTVLHSVQWCSAGVLMRW